MEDPLGPRAAQGDTVYHTKPTSQVEEEEEVQPRVCVLEQLSARCTASTSQQIEYETVSLDQSDASERRHARPMSRTSLVAVWKLVHEVRRRRHQLRRGCLAENRLRQTGAAGDDGV